MGIFRLGKKPNGQFVMNLARFTPTLRTLVLGPPQRFVPCSLPAWAVSLAVRPAASPSGMSLADDCNGTPTALAFTRTKCRVVMEIRLAPRELFAAEKTRSRLPAVCTRVGPAYLRNFRTRTTAILLRPLSADVLATADAASLWALDSVPTVCEVTRHRTELSSSIASRLASVKFLSAMFANLRRVRFLFSGSPGKALIPRDNPTLGFCLTRNRTELCGSLVSDKLNATLLACKFHAVSLSYSRIAVNSFRIGIERMERELERFPLFEPPKPKQLELIP